MTEGFPPRPTGPKGPFAATLAPTCFIDSDDGEVAAFATSRTAGIAGDIARAVALFYAVRDEVEYKLMTRLRLKRDDFKASATLRRKTGFCIEKAVLLAAACRAVGIPARLRFADVRNHLTTPELEAVMGTDIFIFHGLVEMYLDGKWIKATPAFDRAMCERHGVRPIDFDGERDAIFHEFDLSSNRHMEYVNERGTYHDLPYDLIVEEFERTYPGIYDELPIQ